MIEHTGGPFEAVQSSADHKDTWSVRAGEKTTVAKCAIPGKLGTLRNRGNAMLFAASPDLASALDECERLLSSINKIKPFGQHGFDTINNARLALVKAGRR